MCVGELVDGEDGVVWWAVGTPSCLGRAVVGLLLVICVLFVARPSRAEVVVEGPHGPHEGWMTFQSIALAVPPGLVALDGLFHEHTAYPGVAAPFTLVLASLAADIQQDMGGASGTFARPMTQLRLGLTALSLTGLGVAERFIEGDGAAEPLDWTALSLSAGAFLATGGLGLWQLAVDDTAALSPGAASAGMMGLAGLATVGVGALLTDMVVRDHVGALSLTSTALLLAAPPLLSLALYDAHGATMSLPGRITMASAYGGAALLVVGVLFVEGSKVALNQIFSGGQYEGAPPDLTWMWVTAAALGAVGLTASLVEMARLPGVVEARADEEELTTESVSLEASVSVIPPTTFVIWGTF